MPKKLEIAFILLSLIFYTTGQSINTTSHVCTTFNKIPDQGVATTYDTFYLIGSTNNDLKTCLLECNQLINCYFLQYVALTSYCKFYKITGLIQVISSSDSDIYVKPLLVNPPSTVGLQEDWQMGIFMLIEMVNGSNWSLAPNQFNQPYSAIFLNSGYIEVPAGVYFDGGDFTIILWVKTPTIFWQSLLDFGNLNLTNNVIFQVDSNNCPNVEITSGASTKSYSTNQPLILNAWNHMVATLAGTTLTMYLNGMSVGSQTIAFKPLNMTRSTCFIGRSNWYYKPGNPDAIAYIDGVKIYNRALSQQEVIDDMLYRYILI